MILGFDVGNTITTIGCFKKKEILPFQKLSLNTEIGIKKQDLNERMQILFKDNKLDLLAVTGIIFSSVVPPVDNVFMELFADYKITPIIVNIEMRTGLRFEYENPSELGVDRIVNAAAAYHLYKKNSDLIAVDLGTAITFCVILKEGIYKGGIIAPGIGISMDALYTKTSKLPKVILEKPQVVVGTSTISCIQSGFYYGFSSMVRGMIDLIEKQYNRKFFIVITGGFSTIITKALEREHIMDRDLTLKGLKILYDMNEPVNL